MSKMAGNFKVGDLVWAKMKGFPNWPGRVIAPKAEVKRPANKKNQQFVFFFGSENYAWIQEENMHIYADNRSKFMMSQRIPRGYKEAIEAIEDALKAQPIDIKAEDLPSIEDELAQIFPLRKEAPQKDYSRDSGRKRKKSPSPLPVNAKTKTIKDRRSSAPPAPMRDRRRSAHNDQKKNGKNSPPGVRPGREAALAGKETTKIRKNDRGATPKVLSKSSKVLNKPAKKIRKPKPTTPTQSATDNTNEPLDEKLATDTVPVEEKVKESNHTEEDLAAGFGAEDEVSIPEPQESEAQVKSEDRVESPDIFDNSEEGEASSSHNGPQAGDEEPVIATTSDIAADAEGVENNSTFEEASDSVVTTQEPTSAKEPTSARGENIFEMFSQQKDNNIMYQSEEVAEEVIDDIEDEDKMDDEDDDGDYAIVTVDPDGQAHVLLNAETIIDDDVVVLGQEEEVETEGVDAEGDVSIEEAMEMDVCDKVAEVPQEETLPSTSAASIIEQIPYQENIDLKPDSSEQHVVSPVPELPEDQESWDQMDQTETEVEAQGDLESSLVQEVPVIAENSLDSETAPNEDNIEKIEQDSEDSEVQPEEKPHENSQEESATEQESQSETDTKTESATEGETPTRRSSRVRKPKEEAKDKTKRDEPRVGGPGRKPKDTPKGDVKSLQSRRQANKRPASPISATTKRGKMMNKGAGSPGRSAAPADYKLSGGVPLDEIEPAVAGSAKQDIIPTPLKIGFLGLGIMGTGMVENLLKSGHEVTVWNRTGQKCREFMKEGALKGNTPAEVVAACDVTFSCVSDPAAVKDLVFGNCGVLQGIQPGKGYVEMSTIDPDTVADVQEAVTSQGGRFLEAPVVGSRGPASTGQLIILAAGDRMLYEDCFSCFEAMGKKTFFLGETTSGCKMKLVVNMLMGTCVAGLAESLALADKVGLDQDALLQILDLSVMSCPLIRAKGQAIMMSRFEPQFPLQHQQKDLRLSINMADSVDQPLHVATAVNELFKKAKAKGYSQHDMCAVYRAADM